MYYCTVLTSKVDALNLCINSYYFCLFTFIRKIPSLLFIIRESNHLPPKGGGLLELI